MGRVCRQTLHIILTTYKQLTKKGALNIPRPLKGFTLRVTSPYRKTRPVPSKQSIIVMLPFIPDFIIFEGLAILLIIALFTIFQPFSDIHLG